MSEEQATINATIVDVLEGPDDYSVAVGMSYEQKTPTHGRIPLGGEMLLRFPNGNTFTFNVNQGKLVKRGTPPVDPNSDAILAKAFGVTLTNRKKAK